MEFYKNMEAANTKNAPTILIIFGATGDLATKKIVPALFHLFRKDKLPPLFKAIGFSRRDLSDKAYRKYVLQTLARHQDASSIKTCEKFCENFSYAEGTFQDKAGYRNLAESLKEIDDGWGVCSNKLFYLAVPPQFYEVIFRNLAGSGLTKPCSPGEGWSRVLVEKPFGKNLETARKLEKLLATLFKENQIYRIDHYLAKEMVQNILAFRFANNLFEKTWDKNSIEKVEIKLWEKIGVEDRGSFYDGLGALRDVGQNHLLQMVALLAMEHPLNFSSETIREKRAKLLKTLISSSQKEIKQFTFRAQYKGYQKIKGVASGSATETYFKSRVFLSDPRWNGVPFILESGKRLKEQIKEAIITFRHTTPCLCPPASGIHYQNKITIALEPEEKITLAFWSKKPGLKFELQERDFSFLMRRSGEKIQYTEEYEKLLYDCIIGDQTLFVTSGEVEAMWKYIDPIVEAWQMNATPLRAYKQNTEQPINESLWINQGTASVKKTIKKEIGIVGLGKMGGNIARRLMEKGWRVVGYNRSESATRELKREGLIGAYSLAKLVREFKSPRIIWLMVPASAKASAGKPAGKPVDEILFGKDALVKYLKKGDIVIDGGNSFYKDSVRRFKKLKKSGIAFIDVGVSGGPEGARHGASLMVGGKREAFQKTEPLFYDLAQNNGYQFFEGAGAGHFIKMVHNGIEYGMMQAIAEGFNLLRNAESRGLNADRRRKLKYKLDLAKVADIYNHGSVVESRLMAWLERAFELRGENLKNVAGSVGHTGEGEWTVKTAKEMKIKTKIIEESLKFRIYSEKNPSYTGKILSALREQFGGHNVAK